MNYQKCTKCVAHDNADKPVFINDEELSLGKKSEMLKTPLNLNFRNNFCSFGTKIFNLEISCDWQNGRYEIAFVQGQERIQCNNPVNDTPCSLNLCKVLIRVAFFRALAC